MGSPDKFDDKFVLTLKDKYSSKVDDRGFLDLSEFSTQELQRQTKNIAAFLDPAEDCYLGEGLKYEGDPGNYKMCIHIDDLDEFVRRVKEYYGG